MNGLGYGWDKTVPVMWAGQVGQVGQNTLVPLNCGAGGTGGTGRVPPKGGNPRLVPAVCPGTPSLPTAFRAALAQTVVLKGEAAMAFGAVLGRLRVPETSDWRRGYNTALDDVRCEFAELLADLGEPR